MGIDRWTMRITDRLAVCPGTVDSTEGSNSVLGRRGVVAIMVVLRGQKSRFRTLQEAVVIVEVSKVSSNNVQ